MGWQLTNERPVLAVTPLSSQNQQLVVGEVGGPPAYITLHLTLGGPNTDWPRHNNLYSVSKMVLKTKSRPSLTSRLHNVQCPKLGLTKFIVYFVTCHTWKLSKAISGSFGPKFREILLKLCKILKVKSPWLSKLRCPRCPMSNVH